MADADGLGMQALAASQSATVMGVTGAYNDYLHQILVIPATTSPGAITITDGNGSARTVFTGGATSVADLKPFVIPIAARAVNKTTPGWKISTGANVSILAIGRFT